MDDLELRKRMAAAIDRGRDVKPISEPKPIKEYKERRAGSNARQTRKRVRSRQLEVLEMLGGAFCVNCGCADIRILEVNHINGNGNQELREKGAIIARIYRGERDMRDLNVLCRTCNTAEYITRKFGIKYNIQLT